MSRSVVAAMTAYALELREAEVKLNQNEAADDLPHEWKERALAAIVERPWNRYTDFESMTLRAALAKAYAYEPENVLVGNGSLKYLKRSSMASKYAFMFVVYVIVRVMSDIFAPTLSRAI